MRAVKKNCTGQLLKIARHVFLTAMVGKRDVSTELSSTPSETGKKDFIYEFCNRGQNLNSIPLKQKLGGFVNAGLS